MLLTPVEPRGSYSVSYFSFSFEIILSSIGSITKGSLRMFPGKKIIVICDSVQLKQFNYTLGMRAKIKD